MIANSDANEPRTAVHGGQIRGEREVKRALRQIGEAERVMVVNARAKTNVGVIGQY